LRRAPSARAVADTQLTATIFGTIPVRGYPGGPAAVSRRPVRHIVELDPDDVCAAAGYGLTIFKAGCYRSGPYSSRVLARKPASSTGRHCIRLSRVFTSAVSSAMVCLVRFASDRFRCAQTNSTGLSSWA